MGVLVLLNLDLSNMSESTKVPCCSCKLKKLSETHVSEFEIGESGLCEKRLGTDIFKDKISVAIRNFRLR